MRDQLHPLPLAGLEHSGLARARQGLAAVRDFNPAIDRYGSIASHDSGLRFGRLNHALGGTIKPLRLVEADTNPELTSAFGGTADMGGPAGGLVTGRK